MDSTNIKNYLVEHFNMRGVVTEENQWKLVSREKDSQDLEIQEFSCPKFEGLVQVIIKNSNQLSISFSPIPVIPSPPFNIPQFSMQAILAATRLRHHYLELAETYDGNPNDDEPHEAIIKHSDYEVGRIALGTNLAFYFPRHTYENGEIDSVSSLDIPVGEMCVSILDVDPKTDDDLYLNNVIIDEWESIGIYPLDEYTFEFVDQEQTIRQAIQRLLDAGLLYDHNRSLDGQDGCLLINHLSTLPHRPKVLSNIPRPKV